MSDDVLFWFKGILAVTALGVLLFHMVTTDEDMSLARALRYVALVTAAGAIAFASQGQLKEEGLRWYPFNWGGVITALLILIAGGASILEARGVRLPSMTHLWKRR